MQVIYAFHKMYPGVNGRPNPRANSISGYFISWAIRVGPRVRELSLALCPGIVAFITRQLGIEFFEFATQSMASLYIDYFNRNDWLRAVKFFIHNQHRETVLIVFFLKMLISLEKRIRSC